MTDSARRDAPHLRRAEPAALRIQAPPRFCASRALKMFLCNYGISVFHRAVAIESFSASACAHLAVDYLLYLIVTASAPVWRVFHPCIISFHIAICDVYHGIQTRFLACGVRRRGRLWPGLARGAAPPRVPHPVQGSFHAAWERQRGLTGCRRCTEWLTFSGAAEAEFSGATHREFEGRNIGYSCSLNVVHSRLLYWYIIVRGYASDCVNGLMSVKGNCSPS